MFIYISGSQLVQYRPLGGGGITEVQEVEGSAVMFTGGR